MPKIFYNCNGYTNEYLSLNSTQETALKCRKIDLYRAMITVGNPSFITKKSIKEFGLARAIYGSVFEKVGLVFENIQSDRSGMRLHPVFHTHLRDKKRNVSYNLGMAFGKYYAEKLLKIPSLIHVETLEAFNAIEYVQGIDANEREPDLVGQCVKGHWHVVEAKGMSSNKLKAKILDGKQQAERIASINGQTPRTLTACATFFNDRKILTHFEDPNPVGEVLFNIRNSHFYQAAYGWVLSMGQGADTLFRQYSEGGVKFYGVDFSIKGLSLTVGLKEEIYELTQQKEYSKLKNYLNEKLSGNEEGLNSDNYSIGLDGVVARYRHYSGAQ